MQKATIRDVSRISNDVVQYTLRLSTGEFHGDSGQYTVIDTEDGQKPITTMLVDGSEAIIAVRIYDETQYLADRAVSDELTVEENLGGNLFLRSSDTPICLLSTGTGISPMLGILQEYIQNGGNRASFVFGEKNRNQRLYAAQLEMMSVLHDIEYRSVLSREQWSRRNGHVQDHIDDLLDIPNCQYYISGVPEMVLETRTYLTRRGIAENMIFIEDYLD